jgi:hypothetical protein
MLEGLERVAWLMSYTSTHECLFRTHYADNPQSTTTSDQLILDLVSLHKAILRFLEKAYRYYKRNAFSEGLFSIYSFIYSLYVEKVILGIVETDGWIRELMATVDDRKGRVESYVDLLSKESKSLNLFNFIKLDTERGWIDMHADLKKILKSFKDLKPISDQTRDIHQRMKGMALLYLS